MAAVTYSLAHTYLKIEAIHVYDNMHGLHKTAQYNRMVYNNRSKFFCNYSDIHLQILCLSA